MPQLLLWLHFPPWHRFLSDQFDTLKDIIFGGLCLQSQHVFMKIVGVLSWSYLVAFHAWFFYLARYPPRDWLDRPRRGALGANCFNELATSHLSVLLIAPKVQGEWSGGCWEGIILPTIYRQVTKSKRHHLLIENVPQALMSVLFLAVEGGSFFVAALNLVIPGVQVALTFLLFEPVRSAAIPALGKRLNRAMKSGNTIAAKVLWEEVEIMDEDGMYDRLMRLTDAEIMDRSQLFAEMLPHLTFFLDVTKRCDFMSEELKDLNKLSDLQLEILKRMAGAFAQQDFHLSFQQIGDSGAKVLAEALKSSTAKRVHLSCNKIGDQGAEALAESLKTNGSLWWLSLHDNNIGDRGAEALAESLKTNGSLWWLSLRDNNIGVRGAEALAESLKTNGSLGLLKLQNNNIGDCGAEALAAGLLQNRSLSSISLSRDYGYRLWGLWRTQGRKALEEAEKIKQEWGDDFEIWWM
ncbi:unnamed protein product [Cladocopium goreaui]|uniref:Protein NLRC3 n=1 Tax=Cladocopium goreaui TaxID=2562237 RepID=A0A9P1G4U3_9DINO|nr:unnamed protein product [Cladocopium goreaui]